MSVRRCKHCSAYRVRQYYRRQSAPGMEPIIEELCALGHQRMDAQACKDYEREPGSDDDKE